MNDTISKEFMLAAFNSFYEMLTFASACLDRPEDRLYHAEDRTWWKRCPGSFRLTSADAPPEIQAAFDSIRDMRRVLLRIKDGYMHDGSYLHLRDGTMITAGMISVILAESIPGNAKHAIEELPSEHFVPGESQE